MPLALIYPDTSEKASDRLKLFQLHLLIICYCLGDKQTNITHKRSCQKKTAKKTRTKFCIDANVEQNFPWNEFSQQQKEYPRTCVQGLSDYICIYEYQLKKNTSLLWQPCN